MNTNISSPSRSFRLPGYVLLFSSLPVLAGLTGCGANSSRTPVERESIAAATLVLQPTMLPQMEEVPGTIHAVRQAILSAQISGRLSSVPVTLGQEVAAGEILATIEAREVVARVSQARANRDRIGRDLEREQSLLERAASTQETVRGLEDQLRIAEASLEEAESLLAYTNLRAPFAGLITRKHVNEGDLASPGRPLLALENPEELRVEAAVPDAFADRLRLQLEVPVHVTGRREALLGRVEEIAPVANPVSRSFETKIRLPAGSDVRPGQFARVGIPMEAREVLLLPASAIHPWGQMERVFLVENGMTVLRLVRTGRTHETPAGEMVEILAGLQAGDVVVTSANRPLREGFNVEEQRHE